MMLDDIEDPLSHEEAIDALCNCARTVTVLSYREVVEGYFKLRGLRLRDPPGWHLDARDNALMAQDGLCRDTLEG